MFKGRLVQKLLDNNVKVLELNLFKKSNNRSEDCVIVISYRSTKIYSSRYFTSTTAFSLDLIATRINDSVYHFNKLLFNNPSEKVIIEYIAASLSLRCSISSNSYHYNFESAENMNNILNYISDFAYKSNSNPSFLQLYNYCMDHFEESEYFKGDSSN